MSQETPILGRPREQSPAGGREAAEPPYRRPDLLAPLEYPPGELNALEAVTPTCLASRAESARHGRGWRAYAAGRFVPVPSRVSRPALRSRRASRTRDPEIAPGRVDLNSERTGPP